jgi:hypothetical protein
MARSSSVLSLFLFFGFTLQLSIAQKTLTLKHVDRNNMGGLRRLNNLDIIGNNFGSDYPLGLCEGDCDNDGECKGHLVCFHRTGSQTIPGCSGDKPKYSGIDFCYDPTTHPLPKLNIVGNNFGSGYPLGLCEGDCDNDHECAGDLKCFQRSGSKAIPGCTGDKPKYHGVDFCYYPN